MRPGSTDGRPAATRSTWLPVSDSPPLPQRGAGQADAQPPAAPAAQAQREVDDRAARRRASA